MSRSSTICFRAAWVLAWTLAVSSAQAGSTEVRLPEETVVLRPSTLPGFKIAIQKCAICHSADYVAYQPPSMTLAQWTTEMKKMQHMYGAPIDDGEIKLLGIYLATAYGDASSVNSEDKALQAAPEPMQTASSTGGGQIDVHAVLTSNACLHCHAISQKVVGPAYHDVAMKYKDDPEAVSKLEKSIRLGGAGKWGQVSMPPFAALSEAQLKALTEFVLAQ